VEVIGVEPVDADAMTRSLAAGERVSLEQVGLFADGVAVHRVGEHTFALAQEHVDAMVTVTTDEICAAIKDVFEDTRSILEPAGALSVAGLKADVLRRGLQGKTLVAVACGANMNFDRLRFVAERAEFGEQREALFAVTIPEQRGSFKRFCEVIGPRSVTEFNYRISDEKTAHVFIGVATAQRGDSSALAANFNRQGFSAIDLTHDELAKLHLRHMVGGRSELARDERLYRFVFPERPGALMKFLSSLHPDWNISLFHYRSTGADIGRIVVGMQVPRQDKKAFKDFLSTLNYPCVDETDNPAYRLFLR
jgi:threonine dehydratase